MYMHMYIYIYSLSMYIYTHAVTEIGLTTMPRVHFMFPCDIMDPTDALCVARTARSDGADTTTPKRQKHSVIL